VTPLGERPLRTTVVGGGPAGLFYAALAKRRFPEHDVVVHERNAPDATFGFGVVFSERTLSGLGAADPELHAEIERASVGWEDVELRRGGHRLRCGGHGFSAISRRTLLSLLQRRARDAGVDLRFESEIDVVADADLVIAADGVNSATRAAHAAVLRPRMETGSARYIWFATPEPFDALTFAFVEDEHGWWGVHAYPFEDGTSTFIVETDEETWRRAGLGGAQEPAPGESDMASLRFCERLFADHLGGHGLLENNSKWLRFNTLRCERWHSGNVVLAGDAAHTAHFSVGSGTRMAMEDAVALADAVGAAADVPEALAAYEGARRPAVERIQAAAAPSIAWWERFRRLAERPGEQFAFHFLTRSPAVGRARLRARDRGFVRAVERWHAEATGGSVADGPLAAPFELGALRLPSRLVVAPPLGADPLVAIAGPAAAGAGLVLASRLEDLEGAAGWVREHTDAALGLVAGADLEWPEDADVLSVDLDDAGQVGDDRRALIVRLRAPAKADGDDADELLVAVAALASRALLIAAVLPAAAAEPISQLLLCDRLKHETGVATLLVDGATDADAAATAIIAGRADMVMATPSLVAERWRPAVVARV